ncbi:GTP-binding protein [Fimbriimonas ginsengisoli Gsoil 348]|uniref:50S ribosomal subunit assembly factor BipA n=2 Tax=Fimbriimonas ginsengisoli TaxID=1005039 RepID=A0A068NPG3_FIMGI|nr:translational GTPase TypA [Fimbriimonas ginsengisoli]AIE84615.1 GTP-binding protein [Fimbriimonas ginsengisoli Gsoil 348]
MSSPIRNVGIIAHVDHGKTTLVDAIFKQSGTFRENQHMGDRVMDSNDLEREKGITILSKVASVHYKEYKINIVDTPGHADFGGEVERVLSMVDGVLLIVDANEGPMPQTRFVLKKAFENGLKPIVFINKIDRPLARPLYAYDKTIDLFIDLGASEDDIFFPHLYGSGAGGFARVSPDGGETDLRALFEMIVNAVPPAKVEAEGPFLLQVNNLDYSDYLGRMFGGKVLRGTVKVGDRVEMLREGVDKKMGFNITKLWTYEGIQMKETEEVGPGEIAMMAGLDKVLISDTIAHVDTSPALPSIKVEPSTLSMNFYANNSPLAGKDGGKFLTIHKIRERVEKEEAVSVSVKIDPNSPPDTVKVQARGELQLAILIETMRREGYEMQISRPQVIYKRGEKDEILEPFEIATLECPEESVGTVMEDMSRRKGELVDMRKNDNDTTSLEYSIPTRGLIGFRSNFLTMTRGLGLISALFDGYRPYKGEIESRSQGSLINKDNGKLTRYAYEDVQERGTLFYPVGTELYGGMIVGACSRDEDMIVNATKEKAANNIRSASSEATTVIDSHKEFSLEQALSWLRDDELLETTPKQLRFRKKILDHSERRVSERRNEVLI